MSSRVTRFTVAVLLTTFAENLGRASLEKTASGESHCQRLLPSRGMSQAPANRSVVAASSRLGILVLLVAAIGVFAHHAWPEMGMDGMTDATHTCVALAGHAAEVPAAPLVTFFTPLALGLAALFALTPLLYRSSRALRARAGPSERLLPLRC